MKKFQKLTCLVLAVLLCASLFAACGKSDSSSDATSAPQEDTFNYSEGIDENGHFTGVKALEYVTLPKDYNAIAISAQDVAVTDSEVQAQIDNIVASFGTAAQVKDRAVKDADKVNIDYVGSVGGVEFEGGSTGGAGTVVTAGSTEYVDDFLTQIIDHKPGETFDVNVTFPEDYGNEALNGKPAVFKTTINYIEGETQLPELNDAFVSEKLAEKYKWTTVDEMRTGIKTDLQTNLRTNFVWNYVSENATVSEVPKSLIEHQEKAMIAYYKNSAQQYGMTLEDFLKNMLQMESTDALLEQEAASLEQAARQSLILQAIAEDAKLEIDDDAVAKYYKEEMGVDDYSMYSELLGMPYIRMVLLGQDAMNYLITNAKEA